MEMIIGLDVNNVCSFNRGSLELFKFCQKNIFKEKITFCWKNIGKMGIVDGKLS